MAVEVPETQVLDRPGTIRWAVGSPDGPRSNTWMVIGHGTTDEVFIGLREHMSDMKLSLHTSTWRMAYTEAAKHKYVPDGVDRLRTRWEPSEEIARGWRRAASIVITPSNMGIGYPEKRVKKGVQVPFFPAPAPGCGLRFDVLLGHPQRDCLIVRAAAADVGRMTLSTGAVVWIVATELPVDTEFEQGLSTLRQWARERYDGGGPHRRGWAWGVDDEGDVPVLFDLSRIDAAALD